MTIQNHPNQIELPLPEVEFTPLPKKPRKGTYPPIIDEEGIKTYRCGICEKYLSKENFRSNNSTNKASRDFLQGNCNNCSDKLKRKLARSSKTRARVYLGWNCSSCGFDGPDSAFDFHHLNGGEDKDVRVSQLMDSKWETQKVELDKCVLLCANCHRGVHSGEVVEPKPYVRDPNFNPKKWSKPIKPSSQPVLTKPSISWYKNLVESLVKACRKISP